jgi:hypothetical protein
MRMNSRGRVETRGRGPREGAFALPVSCQVLAGRDGPAEKTGERSNPHASGMHNPMTRSVGTLKQLEGKKRKKRANASSGPKIDGSWKGQQETPGLARRTKDGRRRQPLAQKHTQAVQDSAAGSSLTAPELPSSEPHRSSRQPASSMRHCAAALHAQPALYRSVHSAGR